MIDKSLPLISFDDSIKKELFNALGLQEKEESLVDEEGLIQINSQFEGVTPNNFGGILQGSKLMIKKDPSEIISYFAESI